MSDFFGTLELQLREAAERPPRRLPGWRAATVAAALAAVVAIALVPALAVLGGGEDSGPVRDVAPPPVGTVIPKGEGDPPREANSTVVATGRTRVAGPWTMEVHRGRGVRDPQSGETYLRAGGRCLMLYLPDAPPMTFSAGGFCSPNAELGFRKTPGFSRQQANVPAPGRTVDGKRLRVRQVLVYGVVPERASKVVLESERVRMTAIPTDGPHRFDDDFYLLAVPPGLGRARVNWLDERGRPGSRGIGLMPPVTDR